MSTSIRIYKTNITPERNARIDGIEDYLNEIGVRYSDNNFQFVKPELDMTIKLNVSALNNVVGIGNTSLQPDLGNYLKLYLDSGSDNKQGVVAYYYFILEAKWVAPNTVALKCSLDTINTFWNNLTWSDKTSIQREHINRFVSTSGSNVGDITQAAKVNLIVDKAEENIIPARMRKVSDETVSQPNAPDSKMDWYLLYKTNNDAVSNATSGSAAAQNGLGCYLLPDNSYTIKQTGASQAFSLNLNDYVTQNRHYFFTGDAGGKVTFSITSTASSDYGTRNVILNNVSTVWNIANVHILLGDSFTTNDHTLVCESAGYMRVNYYGRDYLLVIGIYHDSVTGKYYNGCFYNNARVFYVGRANDSSGHNRASYISDASFDPTSSTVASSTSINDLFWNNNQIGIYKGADYWMDLGSSGTNIVRGDASVLKLYQNSINLSETDIASVKTLPVAFDNGTSSASAIVKGYNDLSESDLADSKLVKIIDLPYCPSNITVTAGSYILNSSFIYDGVNETLKYNSLRENFAADLAEKPLNNLVQTISSGTSLLRSVVARSKDLEPKLYNSDFYIYKMVYDGNYKQIRYEEIEPQNSASLWTANVPTIKITFLPSNTITSNLGFKYEFKTSTYTEEEDYPVLISARDNTRPIYNNDYINYLRYTYATDRANIDATQKSQQMGIGLGLGSTAASVTAGVAVGAKVGHVAGVIVGAVVGVATGIMSTINSLQQSDANIANANRSLTSKVINLQNQPVSATGIGSAIDIMKSYSDNKLHLMAYEPEALLKDSIYKKFFYCGYAHPVQAIPDFTSRFWFNFVQCVPVFSDVTAYNKYVDDIKARFQIGVTVYHRHYVIPAHYDWDQQYENWELILVPTADAATANGSVTLLDGSGNLPDSKYISLSISSSMDPRNYACYVKDTMEHSVNMEGNRIGYVLISGLPYNNGVYNATGEAKLVTNPTGVAFTKNYTFTLNKLPTPTNLAYAEDPSQGVRFTWDSQSIYSTSANVIYYEIKFYRGGVLYTSTSLDKFVTIEPDNNSEVQVRMVYKNNDYSSNYVSVVYSA